GSAGASGLHGAEGNSTANLSSSGNGGNGSESVSADEGASSAGNDGRKVGGYSVVGWANLLSSIEANSISLLCSSSVRVRHLSVDVLYQTGILRRIIAVHESLPPTGHSWMFRNTDSAYEVLNVLVPRKVSPSQQQQQQQQQQTRSGGLSLGNGLAAIDGLFNAPLIRDFWEVPFGADDDLSNSNFGPKQASQQQQQPLARLASSAREADISIWLSHFPLFVRRACTLIPDVMLVTRTLVCQRLYQMQPLMNQYADISVGSSVYRGSVHVRGSGQRTNDKAAALMPRSDLVSAFGSLFLFAVVSLPTGDSAMRNLSGGASSTLGEMANGSRSPKGNSSLLNGSSGNNNQAAGSASGGGSGSGGRSRLAKSIARKLAPLKSNSRGNKQEHGVGLASIVQLVRMASVILRSDNAPLRQQTAYAFCNTPPAYLQELMQELRPLAESLFDDGSSLSSHRNYLHVPGAAGSALSTSGLMGSLGHGLSSPGHASQHAAQGGSSSSSPRVAAQQAYRAGSSILTAAQLAPHGSSKRKTPKAAAGGSSALAHEGSDTEVTNASGRTKSGGIQPAADQNPGRRANSFDAATVDYAKRPYFAVSTHHGHGDGHGAFAGMGAVTTGNVAAMAAAAAAAAAVNAGGTGSGSVSQMRRRRLRLSLAQIYKYMSRQLDAIDQNGHALYLDEQLMAQLISYIRETKTFLSESSVQWEWEHQPLRIHFCGLVEALYFFISTTEAPAVWLEQSWSALAPVSKMINIGASGGIGSTRASKKFTHETRNGLYQLFERWCGLGRYAETSKEAQVRLISLALEQTKDPKERVGLAALLEEESRMLGLTSLRAMAVLCRDGLLAPVSAKDAVPVADKKLIEPGGPREKGILFAWVSDALAHPSSHLQLVGQRAVEWTIRSDPRDASMARILVQLAYGVLVSASVSNTFSQGSPDPGVTAASGSCGPASVGGSGCGGGASSNATNHGGTTSGLGLVFGAGDGLTLGTSVRHISSTTAAAAATAAMASGNTPDAFSSDRVVLGYLRAMTAIISPASPALSSIATSELPSTGIADRGGSGGVSAKGHNQHATASKSFTISYAAWILPLTLFQLQSEQHRVRRQALLLLRILCMHMAANMSCLFQLDEMGPSIVCDIPAIASGAAAKLTNAVARAFEAHSGLVVMEVVRQVHAQGLHGPRFSALMAIIKPWLRNIVLFQLPADVSGFETYEADVADGFAGLEPIALSRDSLLVLQCMLYLTIKTGHDSMSSMQDLWLALASSDLDFTADSDSMASRSSNMWMIMRYLTGMLMHSGSAALLGFMRRISVFLTRSPQGPLLVQLLIQETMRPTAAVPLGTTVIPAQNMANGMLNNEAWSADITFINPNPHHHHHQDQQRKILVSTGGLSMFYLGAISYEQPGVLAEYNSLALLPSTIILLANPERWIRDAARTVLVNLVASERAKCIRACAGSEFASAVDYSVQANDAAHIALDVLRGDECMGGFGNLDGVSLGGSDALNYQECQKRHLRQDSQYPEDSEELLLHDWSPVSFSVGHAEDNTMPSQQRRQEQQEQQQQQPSMVVLGADRADISVDDLQTSHQYAKTVDTAISVSSASSIGIADPSFVADVADLPVTLSRSLSPNGHASGSTESISQSLGSATRPISSVATLQIPSAAPGLSMSKSADLLTPLDGLRHRSSALSRNSPGTEHIGGGGNGGWGDTGGSSGGGGISGSNRERATLHRFVVQLSKLFGRHYTGCAQEWADVSVQWAMSCPVRPLAGLALQVFSVLAAEAQYGGSLVITPSRQMILRLIDRLSNVVGDPSLEISVFAETVLAGLRQTAGLAARMCAEDEDVKADLLAASLSLMRTAQSSNVYSMALSIFERIFPLVEFNEQVFKRLVVERAGGLCLGGYRLVMLRGLEFASCRDRCLKLIRETLPYDINCSRAGGGGGGGGGLASDGRVGAMLALTAHLPALIEDSVQSAVVLQRACSKSSKEDTAEDQRAITEEQRDGDNVPAAISGAGVGAGRAVHRHNYRRPRAPSFSAGGFGSSLGLMFGGGGGTNSGTGSGVETQQAQSQSQQQQQIAYPTSLVTAILQPAVLGSSARLQLFRRRGQNNNSTNQAQVQQVADDSSSIDDSQDNNNDQTVDLNDTNVESDSETDNPGTINLTANLSTPSVAFVEIRPPLHEKYLDFITYCSQLVLPLLPTTTSNVNANDTTDGSNMMSSRVEFKEANQLFQCLGCLLSPSSSTGKSITQYALGMCRETIQQFGYAAIECGQRVAAEIIATLLQFLNPSSRARTALNLSQRFEDEGRIAWYESDSAVLLSAARAALGRVVALGIGPEDMEFGAVGGDEDESEEENDSVFAVGFAAFSTRSVSPEMPVLNVVSDYDGNSDNIDTADEPFIVIDHSSAIGDVGDNDDDNDDDLLAQLDEFDRELDEALER
ncbi:Cell morphogenesis protein PAG1, partial [Kickxella alabastrina]